MVMPKVWVIVVVAIYMVAWVTCSIVSYRKSREAFETTFAAFAIIAFVLAIVGGLFLGGHISLKEIPQLPTIPKK